MENVIEKNSFIKDFYDEEIFFLKGNKYVLVRNILIL